MVKLNAAARLINAAGPHPAATQFAEKHGIPIYNVDNAIAASRFGLVVAEIDKAVQSLYARGVPRKSISVHEIKLIKGKSFPANGWDAGGLFEDHDGYGIVSLAAGQKFGDSPVLKPGGWAIAGAYMNDSVRHEFGHGLVRSLMTFGENPTMLRNAYVREKREPGGIQPRLSKYAAENEYEYFAEAFAAFMHPKFKTSGIKIYPPLLEVFEKHFGVK
jgi:hypothetical protein